MRPTLSLRIAAVIMVLHAMGHTYGIYTWKRTTGPVPQEVVKVMNETNFPFNRAEGNMAKFYDGLGYASTIALLLAASVLWIVSGFPTENSALSVKVLLPVALFLFLLGVDEVIYFFPMAAVFSFAATLLTAWAIFRLKKS